MAVAAVAAAGGEEEVVATYLTKVVDAPRLTLVLVDASLWLHEIIYSAGGAAGCRVQATGT